MFTEKAKKSAPKVPTKSRLRNIALYYLERFESSEENLRIILRRRIDKYVFFNKEYNPMQAYQWVEDVIAECLSQNFINDKRFADFKINNYLQAGKSRRYIEQKLKQKGIDEKIIEQYFAQINYSEFDSALSFARKKKIGRFRENDEDRLENRQKDLAALVRAGFDYDVAKEILEPES
ncbi:MAG: regulatory protein RecX [Alphaproteobacteria bacterium]|nr:regulatory protein RecX [Alphaproteobacteria bacterium]